MGAVSRVHHGTLTGHPHLGQRRCLQCPKPSLDEMQAGRIWSAVSISSGQRWERDSPSNSRSRAQLSPWSDVLWRRLGCVLAVADVSEPSSNPWAFYRPAQDEGEDSPGGASCGGLAWRIEGREESQSAFVVSGGEADLLSSQSGRRPCLSPVDEVAKSKQILTGSRGQPSVEGHVSETGNGWW
jgi:hypothetical protein